MWSGIGVVAAFCLGFSLPARAALYEFSYLLDAGSTVSGLLDGTVAPDGNTFTIATVQSLSLDGTPINESFAVFSPDFFGGLTMPKDPTATLDGTALDFVIGGDTGGLVFAVGDAFALTVGTDFASALGNYGDSLLLAFVPGNYSARLLDATDVPEPASLALLGLGGAVTLAARRRRS